MIIGVDTNIETANELLAELKATKRALWLARAERAKCEKDHYSILWHYMIPHSEQQRNCSKNMAKWYNVERKCREKAEEYR